MITLITAYKLQRINMQAHMQAVNLSATSYYVPSITSMNYLNYGAAVSEVILFLDSVVCQVHISDQAGNFKLYEILLLLWSYDYVITEPS